MDNAKKEHIVLIISVSLAGLFCILVLTALSLTVDNHADMELQQQHYCDMVQLHKDSNGELGWPDYNNTFKENCNDK